jgi:4-amino-4-deoxy-L-arabinose transferase-like glycosyltransferase
LNISKSRTAIALSCIVAVGAVFRFYGLSWGAPYHHFHIDEHFVFVGADNLREGFRKAALAPKFFMYAPLPMYLLNIARAAYEGIAGPLNLSSAADGLTYMLLGRGISAALGTATIPLVFVIARRLAGRVAGLVAAALLACAVVHLRDSHFFTVDITLIFFCMLTWAAALAMADTGARWTYAAVGVAFGCALACKYTAVFLGPLIVVAHACSPHTPRSLRPYSAWGRWALGGAMPLVLGVAVFLALDPMVLLYHDKFQQDVREQITGPLLGGARPLWNAHFRGIQPQLYWFTNLLPWGIGPAFTAWGLAGVVWLLTRRTRLAITAAAYPLAHYAIAGQTITPFMRYALPLVPGLAVAAGVLSADLLARPRWRRAAIVCTTIVIALTAGYALAYMDIYRLPDARLEASRLVYQTVPRGAAVLVEPSHNIPPTGQYLEAPDFYGDYVGWGRHTTRWEDFELHTLDVYQYLYNPRVPVEEKRAYIQGRLALVDFILMDDTFLELYDRLSGATYQPVRQYYADLFDGRLGFELVHHVFRTPSLMGWRFDDEQAELTFTLFDHPEIFLFKRTQPRQNGN